MFPVAKPSVCEVPVGVRQAQAGWGPAPGVQVVRWNSWPRTRVPVAARAVVQGDGLAVAEGEAFGHPGGGVQHAAHRAAVQLPAEVEQSGALGGDRGAGGGECGDRGAQGLVRTQLCGVHLGKAAADHQA